MLLLGAGASVEAEVPGAYTMTAEIARRFRENPLMERQARVLSFVIGGLLFQEGQRGNDPLTSGVNIEDLFNAVQLLSERHILEAAPFVGSWHAMVEEFDRQEPARPNVLRLNRAIYKSVAQQIIGALKKMPVGSTSDVDRAVDRALANALRNSGGLRGIGSAVETYLKKVSKTWSDELSHANPSTSFEFEKAIQAITEREHLSGGGRIFHETNESMIRTLRELVWISDPARVFYLSPVLNKLKAQGRIVICTLNYDNAIELLAQSNSTGCDTGIDEWSETGTFTPGDTGLYLVKLHGSIDWERLSGQTTSERLMPHSIIHRVPKEQLESDDSDFEPAVIFGQRNKLTADGPFLELLRAFQNELARSELLTIIGYSFRDPHINIYISQWLNQDESHRIRIVDPHFSTSKVEFAEELKELKRLRPEQVENIPAFTGQALQTMYGTFTPSNGT